MLIKKRNMKKSKKKCHMGGSGSGSPESNEKIPDVVYESDLKKELKTKKDVIVCTCIKISSCIL